MVGLPRRRWLLAQFVAAICMGAVALWWVGRGLDWHLVWQTLTTVRRAWVLVSVMGVIAVALAKTARWQALYRVTARRPAFGTLFAGLMAAQAINLAIPIRVGELVRLGWMKQANQPAAITLSTIVTEKIIDLLSAGLMATSLVALAVAPSWLHSQAGSTLLIGLTLVVGLVLASRLQPRLERWLACRLGWKDWLPVHWRGRLVHAAHTMLEALGALTGRRAVIPVVGWTIIVWLLSLLTIVALFAAFELHLPAIAAVLIMLAICSANLAPSPPALLGVMHLIAVVVLGQYGVAQPVAVGFGTVLNIVTVAPLLILGGWALWSHAASVAASFRQRSGEELRAE